MHILPITPDILADFGVNLNVLGVMSLIFIITFIALKKILFQRVLSFMEEREAAVRHQQEEIQKSKEQLETIRREHAAHLSRIEKEANERLQAVLKEALEQGRSTVAQAQEQAARQIHEARTALQNEKKQAWKELEAQLSRTAQEAVQRVVNVSIDATELGNAVNAAAGRSTS